MPDASSPSLPAIPTAALLGLRDGPDAAAWARIRAGLIFAGRQFALFLLAANLIGAAIVTMLFAHLVPLPLLGGWAGATAAIAVGIAVRRLRGTARLDGYATVEELRGTAWEGLVLALAWSAAPLLFGDTGDLIATLGLWGVLAVLMTGAAMAMAPLLLSTLSLLGAVTIATVVPLALRDGHVAAAAATLFAMLLAVAAITRARTLAQVRAAALSLSDRDATVSLLLGEFAEDGTGDGASDGAGWLWETDAARRIVRASPRFALACGIDPAAIDGQPFLQLLAGPAWDSGAFSSGLRQVAERMKNRQGFRDIALPIVVQRQERWWTLTASPRIDADGHFCGFRGVGTDITEQRASADRIHRMARFDALTGLPNRQHVTETLTEALAAAEKWKARCTFMMIDLDRFKAINDTLGHPVGDRLLGMVSQRLGALMSENELVGRLGGDEFAVVVRDGDQAVRTERLAHTIIHTLSQPYELDEHMLYIGASVGIATSPRDGRTADALVRSADLALYRSKDRGGGVVQAYEPQLHAQAEERRLLELALREALEKGELHLHYQPVVEAATGALCGFEALLRWQHPTLGLVPPAKFIPIAQETRLIGPIGEWVVRTACAEAARWPAALRLSINVSAEQLHHPQFVAVLASALSNSGLAPARLDLEVTESVYRTEGTGTARVLDGVRHLGVGLCLDDFGTGPSALGYLGTARFSAIKIDRSFVCKASEGAAEAIAIVRAVVALAGSLGMATVAEGVETDDELHTVRTLGCSHVQGHYFGRPLPVEEARTLAMRTATRAA
ncbi:putative bifunctional diguanylate cyclase/phosphodiesterase [Sphingomonas adhaesiva]|uniref:putative bifunctional diguanylate cyclase/phosphodiesterase n=1 Tax=Sphingomonas adhaesiva TaxID=28212 RepID=UPI002FFB4FDE